jgi:hypothetical protein
LRYSKSLKWRLMQKNNFAKIWINKKYPWRLIANINFDELLCEYNKTGWFCNICKSELKDFDLDHKISLKNWWQHTVENIHFICHTCNMQKWPKNLDEFLKSKNKIWYINKN